MKKIIWLWIAVFIIILSPIISAVDLGSISSDSYILFDLSNGTFINLTGAQNFSNFNLSSSGLNLSINSSYIIFTSGTDKTLSSVTYNNDIWTFTASGTSGILIINSRVAKNNVDYNLFVDSIYNQRAQSNSNGAAQFAYSGWTTHTFSISQSIVPTPVNIASTTGNFFVNTTWNAGSGIIIIDSYNVSTNGVWNNGSTNSYANNTPMSPHGWSNVTVLSYNNTDGLSLNSISLNTKIPNNPITIGNISSSYTIINNQTLLIYPNSTDLDGDTPTFARNFTNGSFVISSGNLSWVTVYNDVGTHNFQINVTDNNGSVSNKNFSVIITQPFMLELPANNSITSSVNVVLQWQEYLSNTPYTYQLSTDNQYINIVSSGSGSDSGFGNGTYSSGTLNLQPNTDYYWKVKNSTGSYLSTFKFTTPAGAITPGQLNVSVFDEQNTSLKIMDFNINIYNTTSYITKSTTTGWTNFSSAEIGSGQYLLIVTPTLDWANHTQRTVLATSPSVSDIKMYVPNNINNTIYVVAFSLLDVTGNFPYTTSVISTYHGGLLMDSSYFDVSGIHPVYLINGSNYQIQVTNGANIFSVNNYLPVFSGTSQITINNFAVNNSNLNTFNFNISNDNSQVTLNWADNYNFLNNLNFTVHKGTTMVQVCNLQTSVKTGQIVCLLSTSDKYHVDFVALLTSGNYMNKSYWFDTTSGQLPTSIGTNPIDNSPMGTGYVFNYNNFVMPRWVYTLVSVIIIIVLLGSFGAYFAEMGSIVTSLIVLLLAIKGWFAPIGTDQTSQGIVITILTFMTMLTFISYIAKSNTGSSMMAYKMTIMAVFTNFAFAIWDNALAPIVFPDSPNSVGYTDISIYNNFNIATIINNGGISIFNVHLSLDTILLTSGLLALFAFSLLVVTIPIMNAVMMASLPVSLYHIINTIPGGFDIGTPAFFFKLPLLVGVGLIYVMGIMQYSARQTIQGV